LLGITALNFYNEGKLIIRVQPDGKVEMLATTSGSGQPTTEAWQGVGTIAADGTVTGKNDTRAHLNADGTVTAPNGDVQAFKLRGDQLIVADKVVTIDSMGNFHMAGVPDSKLPRVEGATDALSRRTALLIFAIMVVE
jgi:hypothetical protein